MLSAFPMAALVCGSTFAAIQRQESVNPLIEIREATRCFQNGEQIIRAVDGVSFSVQRGEFIAIVGESGSGKSTLMNILGCMDRPDTGRYLFDGLDVPELGYDTLAQMRGTRFGFVFQQYNLLNTMSLVENVALPASYVGKTTQDRRARALALLKRFGLAERAEQFPTQLSGGQQQRVAICRALMNNPEVILADEPTGALDSQSSHDLLDEFEALNRAGQTIILITHDYSIAERAQRILTLKDGRIVKDEDKHHSPTETASQQTTMRVADGAFGQSFADLFGTAFRSLRATFLRTFLTLLGIIIGVASIISMLAIGHGSEAALMEQIKTIGTDLIFVQPKPEPAFTHADLAVFDNLPNIKRVAPRIDIFANVNTARFSEHTRILGTSHLFNLTHRWAVDEGAFFSIRDVEEATMVAILGQKTKDTLFPDGDAVGRHISIYETPFEVIGVLQEKGAGIGGAGQDNIIILPITTSIQRLFGKDELSSLAIQVENTDLIDETEGLIREALSSVRPDDSYKIINTVAYAAMAKKTRGTLTLLLGFIASVSLLVGGIGVMNMMLVSVSERTREIGIRLANGARQRDILHQFLVESLLLGFGGGAIGILLGIGASGVFMMFDFPIKVSIMAVILGLGCAVVLTGIFGFLPAKKAARLDPVAALNRI
jgi:macrolide transport system ATP-binding/permease protein